MSDAADTQFTLFGDEVPLVTSARAAPVPRTVRVVDVELPPLQAGPPASPYYRDDLVTLYHGDCREITEWLAADVLVTDPPYGRNWRQGDLNGDSREGISGDKDTTVRDAALTMWGAERRGIVFGDLMLPPPAGTRLVCGYWKAPGAGVRGAMGGVRRDLEAIYLIGRWSTGIGGRSSVFATAAPSVGGAYGVAARAGGHPHTKPQDVVGELLLLTAGIIADPFNGGGSIAVAAKAAGRRCIAVELEESYCEITARRLDQGVLDFGDAG